MIASDLVKRIEAAHTKYKRSQSPADKDALWALQTEYRSSMAYVKAAAHGHRGGTARVTGGVPRKQDDPEGRLADNALPGSIKVDAFALRQLRNLDTDERERGGWLSGPAEGSGVPSVADVHHAWLPDASTTIKTALNLKVAFELLEKLPLDRAVIGDYHSHQANAGPEPSRHDLESWAALASEFRRPYWIGVVVSHRDDGSVNARYAGTDVAAYVVSRDGTHRRLEIQED